MASTEALEWRQAYLQQFTRDAKRTVIVPSTGVAALTYLANNLAANDILSSREAAQAWVESLAQEVEVLYSDLYAGSFEDALAAVTFTSLPFTFTL